VFGLDTADQIRSVIKSVFLIVFGEIPILASSCCFHVELMDSERLTNLHLGGLDFIDSSLKRIPHCRNVRRCLDIAL